MPVLRTLVATSRSLIVTARDVARFQEISRVFITHGFGWAYSQLRLRRELQVEYAGNNLAKAALASPDTGKRLVRAFTQLGPTFVKLGQILSTRTDVLPQSITDELATLQDGVKPLVWSDVDGQLKEQLGPDYRDRLESIDEKSLASASIAQVHRATLKDGSPVVLKVQRPGVSKKIESDLGILSVLARWLEESIPEVQAMDLQGVIYGFTKSITQELDFRIEARNLERFAGLHRDNESVVFPQLYRDLSTEQVLCMEYLEGHKFSRLIDEGQPVRDLVDVYFNVAYKMLFIDGFFHGDLHPGNVLIMEGGRLGILDCGMVGRLSSNRRDRIIDVLYAVLNEDLEAVARTFYELAIRTDQVNYPRFEADVVEIAERYLVGLPLSEVQIGTLFSEIVQGASRHHMRMPTDFTMMFKAILTTEGLAKSIAPDVDPLQIARPFIMQMVQERYSPERLQQLALRDLQMLSRVAQSLPHVLTPLIDDLRSGKVTLALARDTVDFHERALNRRTNRMLRTAFSITFIVCGTISIALTLPIWPLLGIPYLSALFYLAALLGIGTLVFKRDDPLRT